MYTYVKSFLRPIGVNQIFQNIDVSLMSLGDICANYIDGYIELSNTALDGQLYLTVGELATCDLPKRDNITFEYWLSYIGDASLPTIDTVESYDTKYVKCRDVLQAGFHPMICNKNMHYDVELPQSDKPDLYLSKSMAHVEYLNKNALISVNGHLHMHTPYYGGCCVLGGGESTPKDGTFLAAIMSFIGVGDIHFVPFTEDMIHRHAPAVPFNQSVIIDTTLNLNDKSVLLSLGGHLVYSSNILTVVNPEAGIVKINMKKFDVMNAVYASLGKINLESMGLVDSELIDSNYLLSREQILSDVVIKKYLQLKQTFLIVIDTPTINIEKIPVSRIGVAGKFETNTLPDLPLVNDNGQLVEYWADAQNQGWYILHTNNRWCKKRITETKHVENTFAMNASMAVGDYYEVSPHFLKISAQVPKTA